MLPGYPTFDGPSPVRAISGPVSSDTTVTVPRIQVPHTVAWDAIPLPGVQVGPIILTATPTPVPSGIHIAI